MKVMVVVGTRPEVIKMAPVIAALRTRVDVIVCATGQHREMLAQALKSFDITPDVSLDTMSPGQSLNILSARLLVALDEILVQIQPDWVLVQGDTTSAFCAGWAAFHRGIRIAHVEAGLRTGDLTSPFPEEANRSLLARIATRHFAPTALARQKLLREGIDVENIVVTGNTVVDAILQVQRSWENGALQQTWREKIEAKHPLILITCHRRENFGEILIGICKVLRGLCQRYGGYHWIFPVHLNPLVREPVLRELEGIANLELIEPVDYHTSLHLISQSVLVVSDSGGMQEEAPSFGVPVVVMRSHTERIEGINAGFAILAGQTAEGIEAAICSWLDNPERRYALKNQSNPYGDGVASQRIAASLLGEPFEAYHG